MFGNEFDNQTESETEQSQHHISTQNPVRFSTSDLPSSTPSTGDSIFAAIEAGLKYIENNDNKVGSLLDDRLKDTSYQLKGHPNTSDRTTIAISTTTESELSFLDLLLGVDEDEEKTVGANNTGSTNSLTNQFLSIDRINQPKTTEYDLEQRKTISGETIPADTNPDTQGYTLADIIQTSNVQSTETISFEDVNSTFGSTTQYESTTSLEDINSTANDNILKTNTLISTTETFDLLTSTSEGTTEGAPSTSTFLEDMNSNFQTDNSKAETTSTTVSKTTQDLRKDETIAIELTTASSTTTKILPTTTTEATSTNSFDQDLQELLSHSSRPKPNKTNSNRPKRPLRPQIRIPESTDNSRQNATIHIKATTENIFSALFGGISNIFSDTNTTSGNINRYKIRVNNDTNGSINRWPAPFSKITTTTEAPTLNDVSRNITSSSPEPTIPTSTTPALIVINSNPSILESDLNYDYGEPTLPPSLPNLNIIPFLPTDAVKTNRNHESFGFVHTNSTSSFPTSLSQHLFDPSYSIHSIPTYPKSSSNTDDLTKESKSSSDQNEYELFQVGAQMTGESPDRVYHLPAGEDGYHPHSYPSITEPNFDVNDNREALFPNFSKYGNNKYHQYGPYASSEHRNNDYDSKATSDSDADAAAYGIVTGYEPFESGEYSPDNHGLGVEFKTSNPLYEDNRNNQFSPPSETEGKIIYFKYVRIGYRSNY